MSHVPLGNNRSQVLRPLRPCKPVAVNLDPVVGGLHYLTEASFILSTLTYIIEDISLCRSPVILDEDVSASQQCALGSEDFVLGFNIGHLDLQNRLFFL